MDNKTAPVSAQTSPRSKPVANANSQAPQTPKKPNYAPYIIVGSLIVVVISLLVTAFAFGKYAGSQTVSDQTPTSSNETTTSLLGQFFHPRSDQTTTQTTSNTENSTISTDDIVDTDQHSCYSDQSAIDCGQSFYGQDAQYQGNEPNYQDNGNGTITDLNTGLMWIQDAGNKVDYYTGINNAKSFSFAGYSDWRVPTIKELYSLIDFSGHDVDPTATSGDIPFINNKVFVFNYGDLSAGDRIIDSQWITSNIYTSKVMNNQECFFGVNFADGRIKCYPTNNVRNNGYYMRLVRGKTDYGVNKFTDNGNGTITDSSSGMTWQQADSGKGMDWGSALTYCENLSLGGYSDWRLPNAKELEYIVDYARSPDFTNSPAIDPIFKTSSITNEVGQKDYPFYWTSTTHLGSGGNASQAVYVAFGRALGKMNGNIIDVHGAGAQRSDPKSGNINDYPQYMGPQGDVRRLYNYVRCVRGGATFTNQTEKDQTSSSNQTESGRPTPSGTTGQSGQTGSPPQAAITACSGKSAGTACSFTTQKGTITGTCQTTPDSTVACVPSK